MASRTFKSPAKSSHRNGRASNFRVFQQTARAQCRVGRGSGSYAPGNRSNDIYTFTLPRNFAKGGEIARRRAKTGEPVFWPMPRPLADIFDKAPTHAAVTLCANSRGHPWTLNGFRASWRSLRILLEKEGRIGPALTLYGLRHTVAVILRESGCDERTIADALGQKTIEMARHYAEGADLTRKMRGVVKSFDAELAKRRTKIVKPD
jgi:integrase